MTPIAIRKYLQKRRVASLQDMAVHFRMTSDTISPIIELWIRKGKIKKHACGPGCGRACCCCDPTTMETYEWLGDVQEDGKHA